MLVFVDLDYPQLGERSDDTCHAHGTPRPPPTPGCAVTHTQWGRGGTVLSSSISAATHNRVRVGVTPGSGTCAPDTL